MNARLGVEIGDVGEYCNDGVVPSPAASSLCFDASIPVVKKDEL